MAISNLLTKRRCLFVNWTVEALIALEKSLNLLQESELVCKRAESLLWAKTITHPSSSDIWEIEGLTLDGGLKVKQGLRRKIWNRW